MVRAGAIGWRAHAALTTSAGVATVIAPLSRSFYAEAAGELIWIGDADAMLHPRAILATGIVVPAVGARVSIAVDGVVPWRPARAGIGSDAAAAGARALRAALGNFGPPRGLARVLMPDGNDDDDPVITRAAPHVRALAAACAGDDPQGAVDAARPLLGLGDGLTPSGDDFVGGVLFARHLLDGIAASWETTIMRVVTDAGAVTHPISARLLADLAAGEGWAPLHCLASAMGAGDARATHRAAHMLTTLGNTSGWSLLGGVVVGLGLEVTDDAIRAR